MADVINIVDIEVAGPDRKARRLLLDDHTTRTTSAAVVKALDLIAPCGVDIDLLTATEHEAAKDRALRLLGYRERSPQELRDRLRLDGYPDDVGAAIVARLEELELVDETRFAEMYVRSRLSAGHGRRRIARDLAGKGVCPQVVAALTESLRESDLDRAKAALRPSDTADRRSRDKAWRRLVSKGFDPQVVSAALEAAELDL